MKKIIALFLCLLIVGLCFTGCRYVGKTDEYELYDKFARRHDAGMTKQEVFDKLGCPDRYYYANGEGYSLEYHYKDAAERKKFEADLSSDTSIRWRYKCMELGDSNEYWLTIEFDSDGKSVSAEMKASIGG